MLRSLDFPATRHAARQPVAHVAFSLRTGGMERLLVEFARQSDRERFPPSFYCLTDGGAPADDIEAAGCRVERLHKADGFRWSTVWDLARRFRRDRIAVVHTHNSGAMIYGALAAKLSGARVVIHTRHGQRFGASRRQTWLFARLARWIDRLVGVSWDGAEQSIREGVPQDKVATIWNGIDLTRFGWAELNVDGPALLVSRLVPEKDLPNLIDAAALLAARRPAFRLRIVGDGPALPDARRRVAELGLADRVEFLGERRDVPELLRQASCFVLPSKTEGVSLTLLEAMAAGLPVVATRVGGNSEVVVHGETGLLVPSGDPAALADALEQLAERPAEARAMGLAGRRRVESHFDVRGMVRAYEQLYADCVARRRPAARPSWETCS